nr:MAG TPA: hypothetical protein [Caudoviricetes sp.]
MSVLFVKYGISKRKKLLVCKISKGIPECLINILSCTGIVIKFSVSAPIGKENETNAYKPRSYQQNRDKNLVNILNIKKCNMV